MKELSIKEKVKAYDEALKRAVVAHKDEDRHLKAALERIFPELKESDEERIRKWIKKELENKYVEDGIVNNVLADKAFAWLEKQKHLYETTKDRFYLEGFEEGQLYEKQKEQKPAEWHREDEQNLNACLGYIPDEFLRRWLMDAIHTKYDKPTWSEEDETGLTNTIIMLKEGASLHFNKKDITKTVDWLKSFKDRVQPQPKWKPSDLQIEALESATANCAYSEYEDCLKELIEQLKQL